MSVKSDEKTLPQDSLTGRLFGLDGFSTNSPGHWKRRGVITVYPYALVLTDLVLLLSLYFGLWAIRHATFGPEFISLRMLAAIIVPTLVGHYLIGGYNYATQKNRLRYVSEHLIISAAIAVSVTVLIYAFLSYGRPIKTSRYVIFGTLTIFPTVAIAYRWVLGSIQSRFETKNAICIIGANDYARDLVQRFKDLGMAHEIFVFSHDPKDLDRHLIADDPSSPVINDLNTLSLDSSVQNHYVEAYVIAANTNELPAKLRQAIVVSLFNSNQVFSFESFVSDKLKLVPPTHLSMEWPLSSGFSMLRSKTFYRWKLLTDRFLAAIGILVCSPLLIFIALLVKATSKGPVIFKQRRTGLQEKPFWIYKFRTMREGSETGPKYTAENDSRITLVGGFLRKTRLDELPQFFNVLKGDLSLIGPRAEWVDLVESYEAKFPCYHFRHAVRPGITGWAQVNYSYGASDKDTLEKLGYDLYYVKNCSPMLDVVIFVKTIYIVLFGRGR